MTVDKRHFTFCSPYIPNYLFSWMASLSRKPLVPRSLPQKRPRSPDHHDPLPTSKRVRPAPYPTHDPAKDRRNPDKEKVKAQLKAEFKDKYCRAFPSWIFYFDSENTQAHPFEARIHQLGAVSELLTLTSSTPQNIHRQSKTSSRSRSLMSSPIDLSLLPLRKKRRICQSLPKPF